MAYGKIRDAVLIGAGNVAWHLGHALSDKGIRIRQVVSRSLLPCRQLAGEIGAMSSDNLRLLDRDADAYILAVPDNAIPAILREAAIGKGIVLHTSGSISMEVFSPFTDHAGVLYPIQTFTKGRRLDFSEVPLLIEACNPVVLKSIRQLAEQLSENVVEADSATRCMVHVAAVFACNFTNHMYSTAEMLLREHHHSLELLKPLMRETLLKALEMSPEKAQTGPALRGDRKVIRHHLEQLQQHPELAQIYRTISRSIQKQRKRD